MSNDNYSLQKPSGYMDRFALRKRLDMLNIFFQAFPEHSFDYVLDVGVTADINALSSNYFEKYFPNKHKILALSNQDASFLEDVYPGLTFKLGDACHLPFDNNSIDVIFSSAVIEHVGSLENQTKMLAECIRVAKKGVFITTPNRWYPLEIHTLLPLIHWLPKHIHRNILRMIGLAFYAQEENLNLLDRQSLSAICKQLDVPTFQIKSISALGFTSNFALIINK
jgi:hypothetical protein